MLYIKSFAPPEHPCSWNGVMDRNLLCLARSFIIGEEMSNPLCALAIFDQVSQVGVWEGGYSDHACVWMDLQVAVIRGGNG